MEERYQSEKVKIKEQVERLLREIHDLLSAEKSITAFGKDAIDPLQAKLQSPPESIPHTRVLAVRALGHIGGPEAIHVLRDALFHFSLRAVDPVNAHAESLVKNAIVEELVKLEGVNATSDYLEAFRAFRLPAAARAIGWFHLVEGVPELVRCLEDDVIGSLAAEVLCSLGHPAVKALIEALRPSFQGAKEARISKTRRILAAITLGHLGERSAHAALIKVTMEPDPTLAGAAAAAAFRIEGSQATSEQIRLILQGTLCDTWLVREECREVAEQLGNQGLEAALGLIELNSLPDLYGIPHPTTTIEKRWLVAYLIENARAPSLYLEELTKRCPKRLLYGGIWLVQKEAAIRNLRILLSLPDADIRQAVVHALGRFPTRESTDALITALATWRWRIAKEAIHALEHFPTDLITQSWASTRQQKTPLPFIAIARMKWLLRRKTHASSSSLAA